jgi:hypothetical protein
MAEGHAEQAVVGGGTKRARGSDGGGGQAVDRARAVDREVGRSVKWSGVGVGEEVLTGDDQDRLWANVTRKARRGSRAKLSHIWA